MKWIAFAGCLVLVGAGAAVHGAATHRWAAFTPEPGKAEAVHGAVVALADYRAEEVPSEIPIKEQSRVSCRRYFSSTTGLTGVVTAITGPPGAVSTHTPDVCYVASGYTIAYGPVKETIELPGIGTATYFVAEFEKKTSTGIDRQRVRWAWATGAGMWDVPDLARFVYLREPELYKVYAVTQAVAPEDGAKPGPDSPAAKSFVVAAFSRMTDAIRTGK